MTYLVKDVNGIRIQDIKPCNGEIVEFAIEFSSNYDALQAKMLCFITEKDGVSVTGENAHENTALRETINALRETINAQGEIIRKLNIEIDNKKLRIVDLRENVVNLKNAFDGLRRVMRRVMAQLALQTVLQKTHKERNSENRQIVTDMKYWHDKPSDTYANMQDMEDIPF